MDETVTVWGVVGDTRTPLFLKTEIATRYGLTGGSQITDYALFEEVVAANAPTCSMEEGCGNCGS